MSGLLLARRWGGATTGLALPAIGDAFMGGYYAGIIDTTKSNIIASDASQTGLRYALIVAPKSLEQTAGSWKTTADAGPSATRTRWDGLAATAAMVAAGAAYQVANTIATLTYPSDAASSWYLPALDELELVYRNLRPTTDGNYTTADTGSSFPGGTVNMGYNPSSDPAGAKYTSGVPAQTSVPSFQSGGAQALRGSISSYWTATESSSGNAWMQYFFGAPSGKQLGTDKRTSGQSYRPVRRLVLS